MATVQDLQAAVEGEDGRVIACLQDYREELMDPECRAQVHRLTQRASQDIRMDVPLSEACFEDCSRLCGSIQPVCCPSGGCLCAGGPAARLPAAASACGGPLVHQAWWHCCWWESLVCTAPMEQATSLVVSEPIWAVSNVEHVGVMAVWA